MQTPPKRNQPALIEHYLKAVSALVIDVGSGRLRLRNVQIADEGMDIAVRLAQILDDARASK